MSDHIERRLILACVMAIVFRLYEDKWGQFGGLVVLGLCMAWAIFISYAEYKKWRGSIWDDRK